MFVLREHDRDLCFVYWTMNWLSAFCRKLNYDVFFWVLISWWNHNMKTEENITQKHEEIKIRMTNICMNNFFYIKWLLILYCQKEIILFCFSVLAHNQSWIMDLCIYFDGGLFWCWGCLLSDISRQNYITWQKKS